MANVRHLVFGAILNFFVLIVIALNVAPATSDERELHSKLLQNYNVHILPPHNDTHPTTVALDLVVVAIRELNEKAGFLTLDAWLHTEWNDSRLKWEPDSYEGVNTIRLPFRNVWHPDITLYNRVKLSDSYETQSEEVLCTVDHRGKVILVLPRTLHSSCSVDLRFYPFDVQRCNLTFGSWTINGFHLAIKLLRESRKVEFAESFNQNNQWEVLSSRASSQVKYYVCCPDPYPDATFELRVRRRSPYYKYTTLYPALGVVGLTLIAFWLPPDAAEKVVLSGVSFLSLVLLLVHFSWTIPPTRRTIPMIVAFCGNLIMIVTVSIMLSVFSIVWGRTSYKRRPPRWMRSLPNGLLGKCLCVNTSIVLTNENPVDDITSIDLDGASALNDAAIKSDYRKSEWKQCLELVDRVNFVIFVGVIISTLAGAFTLNE